MHVGIFLPCRQVFKERIDGNLPGEEVLTEENHGRYDAVSIVMDLGRVLEDFLNRSGGTGSEDDASERD